MGLSLTILAFIFVTGLVVGSFLNVVILRTVSEMSIVFPSSRCPHCQTPLKWFHNIPILSYVFLRGKCAFCNSKISLQYPFVELLTGILFVLLFIRVCHPFDAFYGLTAINPISLYQIISYIFVIIVTCLFISIAGTDILEKKVSDNHTIPLIVLGLLYSLIYSIVGFVKYISTFGLPEFEWSLITNCPFIFSLGAGLLGFLLMEAVSRLGLALVGTRAFGEGDSFIAAGIGTVMGALLGCSSLYKSFLPIFETIIVILTLSAIIQLIVALPLFIKKLIINKRWKTIFVFSTFIIYTIVYFYLQNNFLLDNKIIYWVSSIFLVVLGLYNCREILYGLKLNKEENATFLPFGPAMIVAALLAIFFIAF